MHSIENGHTWFTQLILLSIPFNSSALNYLELLSLHYPILAQAVTFDTVGIETLEEFCISKGPLLRNL